MVKATCAKGIAVGLERLPCLKFFKLKKIIKNSKTVLEEFWNNFDEIKGNFCKKFYKNYGGIFKKC